MANGDRAAAAGIEIVAPTDDLRNGYDEINRALDLIVEERTRSRPVSAGGTGGTTQAAARDGIGAASKQLDNLAMNDAQKASMRGFLGTHADNVPSRGATGTSTSNVQADLIYLDGRAVVGINDAAAARTRAEEAKRGELYVDSYNRSVSGQSVKVAYLGNTGQLGFSSSSETVKEDIAAFDVTDAELAAVQLVTYRYIAQQGEGPHEAGVIAERLIDAGLAWLVFFDEEGAPQGVHYERLALALLPVVQRLMADRDDIARRVAALEQKGAE